MLTPELLRKMDAYWRAASHLNGYKISNPTLLARITPRGIGTDAPRLAETAG
jgi:phosphoketolase